MKPCIHKRSIQIYNNKAWIVDEIIGCKYPARGHIFFHPELDIEALDDHVLVSGKRFKLKLQTDDKNSRVAASEWYPSFNVIIPNKVLIFEFVSNKHKIDISWEGF